MYLHLHAHTLAFLLSYLEKENLEETNILQLKVVVLFQVQNILLPARFTSLSNTHTQGEKNVGRGRERELNF